MCTYLRKGGILSLGPTAFPLGVVQGVLTLPRSHLRHASLSTPRASDNSFDVEGAFLLGHVDRERRRPRRAPARRGYITLLCGTPCGPIPSLPGSGPVGRGPIRSGYLVR